MQTIFTFAGVCKKEVIVYKCKAKIVKGVNQHLFFGAWMSFILEVCRYVVKGIFDVGG